MKGSSAVAVGLMGGLAACIGAGLPPENRVAREWAGDAFGLERPPMPPEPPKPGLTVRRQDHGVFRLNRSVLDTPLRLGDREYEHGLGTHSVSEIAVRLPAPGREFTAHVGIDRNDDTGGVRGSVVFVVEAAGAERFRSGVRTGADGPLPVRVDLAGEREFVLRVSDADDGPGWDQADWADAAVVLEDGSRIYLDALPVVRPVVFPAGAFPVSFRSDGISPAELRAGPASVDALAETDRIRSVRTVDAAGVEITCDTLVHRDFPAVEWVASLRNVSDGESALLEDILPLDIRVPVSRTSTVRLRHNRGSRCEAEDFLPLETRIDPGREVVLAPNGGRSSDGHLPFFDLDWETGGIAVALGWSGQWSLRISRDPDGALRVRAGQQTTRLRLHPGEAVRTPRILLVFRESGDEWRGPNLMRQLLLAHYLPRRNGEPVTPPVTQNTWFVFSTGNGVTEANQLEAIDLMSRLGVEAYWLDAGWFVGGWPSGVGSWSPRTDVFPRGLAPLGAAARERGLGFVLWFEPERVHPDSEIGRDHPEFVLRAGPGDGLFNLGDPTARAWLTDRLSSCIAEAGVTVYRNDFNIDPLRFWQAADEPERQGIAEIRYMEGLYAMWDELARRNPGLWIDTCASGGRRIDLEILMRSLPLWRSDTQCCGKAMPAQDQSQIAGLSLWLPLHAAGVWGVDPYVFRSVAAAGVNLCFDGRSPDLDTEAAKAAIAELKSLRPFYAGEYRPVFPVTVDATSWCGWQYHRPDSNAGFVMLFRRDRSPYTGVEIEVAGVRPADRYRVTRASGYEVDGEEILSGADLARLGAVIPDAPGSLLIRYEKVPD